MNKNLKKTSSSKHKQTWKHAKERKTLNLNSYTSIYRRCVNAYQHKCKMQLAFKTNLKEDQVGITEFVNSGPGFTGVVKSRFSDFHVNEIDVDGFVLKLTELAVPQPRDDSLTPEELKIQREQLDSVLSQEVWNNIENIINNKCVQECKHVEIDVTDLDKEKRTQIHKVMKKLYENKIVSSTVTVGEKKIIKLSRATGKKGDKDRTRWRFPGEYVHFLLYKENMETSEVASIIAKYLKMKPSQVNYCGTKDKRGKTTQKFCIRRRDPNLILKSVKYLLNVRIGNFTFKDSVLKLGDLNGNRFRIALRHVSGDRKKIEENLNNVKRDGFINYFGLQRFGNNPSIPTYQVGIALLKCDYKLACELILKPRENDIPFMREIREMWWKNRNSTEAAAMFSSDKFIEKKLLEGLSMYGETDYASALRKIPRNMLLLYPHAYQSLVFNRVASRRIKEFGLKIIAGDLVYRNKDEIDIESVLHLDTFDLKEQDAVRLDSSHLKEATKEDEEESIFKQKVKCLTEEDINSGKYTMFDIVLPLPGYDITYPSNSVGQWYEEILQENELSSSKLKHNVKTYSMPGAYRKLLIQPQNMSWDFRTYDTPESTLILSDWEELKGQNTTDDGINGKYQALLIDFCLPASAYATMLLREILKSDTCAENQAQIEKDEMTRRTKDESEVKRKLGEDATDSVDVDSIKKLKLNDK